MIVVLVLVRPNFCQSVMLCVFAEVSVLHSQ